MGNWLSDAIEDIRQKVLEEPWFGRETTTPEPEAAPHINIFGPEKTPEATPEREEPSRETMREIPEQGSGREIER